MRSRWGVFAAIVILVAMTGSQQAGAETTASRPNILVSLGGDLGWSDIGCYGSEIRTPHLDRLAQNGLRFTHFYNATRCCPTRASLLTGLHPHQAGMGWMNFDQKAPGYRGLPQPNAVMIPHVLKSAGYRTYMVGKWHLGLEAPKPAPNQDPKAAPPLVALPSPTPVDRGFDEFYGMIGGFNSCFEEQPWYSRLPADRKRREYPQNKFYSTDVFGDYSLDFIADARQQHKPFFLYLAFNAPHFPLHALPEDIKKYAGVYNKGWDKLREERLARQKRLGLFPAEMPLTPRSKYETRRTFFRVGENPPWDTLDADRQADLAGRMTVYAAMVDRMDANIGRIVDNLKAHGQLDNTLILFLSDNGACAEWDPFGFDAGSGPTNILYKGDDLKRMGGPDTYHSYGSGWANACNTPFRWYKHYAHEGGIATPLIVHWPAKVPAKAPNQLRHQPGHIVDIMATCVAVSGAKYPQQVNQVAITPAAGKSLLPAFENLPIERDFLAWEHEKNCAIRAGKWKLVAVNGSPWELYDMEADPTEMRDLAPAHPDKVKELTEKWTTWAKANQVFPYPEPPKKP